MPIGWRRFLDASGRAYFHNPNSGTTQWEPPILRYQSDEDPELFYYYDPVMMKMSFTPMIANQ